jgi:trans-2,3-dihydro-3-hydroxyanthranilate isomerase
MKHRFYIVDVFAEKRHSGNPLAVVVGEDPLPAESMQSMAAEVNFSETTFVSPVPQADGGYRVRIFTPAREIAFAGHPILGTAAVLKQHLGLESSAPLQLNLAVGPISVTFEAGEVAWFRAPQPTFGASCAREAMAAALDISACDIAVDAPVQQVSATTAAMIVPLVSLDALHRSHLDLVAYRGLAAQGYPPLIYLFCSETHDRANDYCARFFFEAHGVREDPATGNGAAFLGAYLMQHGLRPASGFFLRIEQGHEVQRPSLVLLRGRTVDGAPEVSVGGSVIPIVRGELY